MNPSPFELIAGELCLELANTVGGTRSGVAREKLPTYAEALEWAGQAGLLLDRQKEALAAEARRHPSAAAAVHRRALVLREAIFEIFAAIARGQAPAAERLSELNAELGVALAHSCVAPQHGCFTWIWVAEGVELDCVLWPVAKSAADLLTNASRLARVRECCSETCGWLFLDTTKNRSRCWCEMKSCGNAAKVRRFRQRRRAEPSGG